uniref:NADH-ubiquinone oxidoreductase chain 4 n=1 Tax=Chiropterargas boueti TaxID=1827022 RepID=A0A1P8AG37_9ACAR|nr:NADH dehydrogenase subunit 4 [Chiropterargas boueti]AMX74074.1 NADH dehydrogenase subunit 4 [Chiropterargas boueti]AMX74087.1 NADH dehydrogenase subunit 4 [Chiropterargas boueti]
MNLMFLLFFMMMCFSFYITLFEYIIILLFMCLLLIMLMDWSNDVMFINSYMFVDMFSLLLIMLTLWVVMLMYLSIINKVNVTLIIFYINLLTLLLFLSFSVMNLLSFYIMFESVLLPMVMIIFGWGGQYERLQAGLYMLFYTIFGSLPLLLFILWLEPIHSMFCFKWINFNINIVLFMMAMMGFLVKLPIYFLHLWLPKAHVEAPLIGSMILAGVLLKLGVYGIYRLKFIMLSEYLVYGMWLQSICLIGCIYICILCMCQVDIKSLIAYSSVSHMSLLMGGFISSNYWGDVGVCLMMIGHGLCSSGLFCLSNILYERFYTRSILLLKGLGCIYPVFSMWCFIFVIINMAAPPFMNMGAEIFLFSSMLKWSFLVFLPLIIISFLSACYSLYFYSYMNHGKGWMMMAVKNLFLQEMLLLYFHMFPLVLWVMKFEFFINL